MSTQPPIDVETVPVPPSGPRPRPSRWKQALAVAIVSDALQIVFLPLLVEGALSPAQDVLDVAVGAIMVALMGWNVAFLPAFVAELVPVLDLFPTWTAAVLFAAAQEKAREMARPPAPPPPPGSLPPEKEVRP
ncbi:MAG TPA: hypothetical protein VMS93_06620 [Candidatus Saccharimonadales bacterium]|nr:hypothetical protein [Candidatus Saccharimonadales bacterium]